MPGETKGDISGWTVDTLHAHIQAILNERDRMWLELRRSDELRYEQRFVAQEKATKDALASATLAGTKAETAIEKRLENTNEWRQAVNDRDKEFLPRPEYDRAHLDLEKRLEEYKKAMEDKVTTLSQSQIRAEGRGSGLNAGWGYLIGAIGVFLALYMALRPAPAPTLQPTLPMQVQPQQPITPAIVKP